MRLKQMLRRFLMRKHAAVIAYHSVLATPARFDMWHHLVVDEFERQIAHLARNSRCVPLSTLVRELRSGHVPPYTVALTFDDGFANNLHVALPVLQKYGVPATLCVTTGPLDSGGVFWPETIALVLESAGEGALEFRGERHELRDRAARNACYRALIRIFRAVPPARMHDELAELVAAAGTDERSLAALPFREAIRMMTPAELRTFASSPLVEIGAHTVNHWRLSALDDAAARAEIEGSARRLRDLVGRVTCFAYPHGLPADYRDVHRRMAAAAGLDVVLTADTGTITPGCPLDALPRLSVGGDDSFESFRYMVDGGAALRSSREART